MEIQSSPPPRPCIVLHPLIYEQSVVFPVSSISLVSAQLERDALVQGFAMLVEDLKAAAGEGRFHDAEAGITRNI